MIDRQPALEAMVRRAWAGQDDPAHDIGHLRRVWALCRRIAGTEPAADLELLQAAAFLHDLVNLPKSHPDRARASTLSAEAALRLMAGTDFPAQKLAALSHAIAAHSYSAGIPPRTLDARILEDADRLDALGAIGLARMFAVSGALGRALVDIEDPLARRRPLDEARFALDHLETKLFRLPALMHTAEGKRLAKARVGRMRAFRDDFLAELSGDPQDG